MRNDDTDPNRRMGCIDPNRSMARTVALDLPANSFAPNARHAIATSDGKHTQAHGRRIFLQLQWADQKSKQGSATPRPRSERSK